MLIVRAFVEESRRPRLLVQLLEVNLPGPDRVIGIVESSSAACRLVGQWLGSLEADPADSGAPGQSAEGEQ